MKVHYLIHQFYPEYQPGTEKFIYNMAFMTQKSGHKVKVVTYGFYDRSFFDQEDKRIIWKEFIYNGIPVLAFQFIEQPMDLHISLADDAAYDFAKRIIKKEAPDVIHMGHPMRVYQFFKAAKELNVPVVTSLTDFFLICPRVILSPTRDSLCSGPEKGEACKRLCGGLGERFLLDRLSVGEQIVRSADVIVSPSKFLAQIFLNEIEGSQIFVNNHGVRYANIKQNQKVYTQSSPIVFGFTGYIQYHKGVHLLIKAFSAIDNRDVRLVIYGPGDEGYMDQLYEIAHGDDRIEFKGPFSSEQLADIYQEIDVLVTPSICYENYPLVLHEALASNVPVIASDLGGLAEKINNGVNGLTFVPGDVDDLRDKMASILNDREVLNRYKQNIKSGPNIPNVEQEAYWYQRVYRSLNDRIDLLEG
jgi:glycosyltransferase involved in cell wall biosynthesis